MRVLVTGAGGFLGQSVVRRLLHEGIEVLAITRNELAQPSSERVAWRAVGDLVQFKEWPRLLQGIDGVMHLAARAHRLSEQAASAEDLYRASNVDVSLALARAAADAGVRRFVFVSTIGVHGNSSGGTAITEDSPHDPQTAYARSKWDAECRLGELSAKSGLGVVVIRPPLVYGPTAPGNFGRLANWVMRERPLPLASVENARSLVFRENLADALVSSLKYPGLGHNAFVISDGEDVSTPELIRLMASYASKRARLFNCPPTLLRAAGRVLGKEREVSGLIDSFCIDSRRIRAALAWSPPFKLREGLEISMAGMGTLHG